MSDTQIIDVDLHEVTRNKFLNYAMSVITSRALPDVRDGLKPVQRRILYTMAHDLRVTPDKSTIKCAKVVGQVLGNYHPHGDSAVYEALVRMAQPWTLRYPLIHGQGNFGSLDGDAPAAYRYTESRLTPLAMEFVKELGQETVDFRKNFDDSQDEPVVLPARFPQLLANGCTGIAVGVATNIPPHNLNELCQACEVLVDDRHLDPDKLLDIIQGPDFPTGGQCLENRQTLEKLYREGHGKVRVRGTFELEETRRGPQLIITSLPYQTNKSELVVEIADLITNRKIPQLLDIRDESTESVRIVLECKRDSDLQAVKAYLFKNTGLQNSFHVNMTCLVFEGNEQVGNPARLGLKEVLLQFLDFRHQVTTRRLSYDLKVLMARIHVLQGFAKVFDGLDDAIAIIRTSDGRQDAALKLIARFNIDQEQADAVLELRLYKLGRTDILEVQKELQEKMQSKVLLEATLANPQRIWGLVKRELREVRTLYGDPRRTEILADGAEEISYTEDAFIVDEEAVVVLSRDGWVRRVSTGTDLNKLRLRQDDVLSAVMRSSTRSTAVFFSNLGSAYAMRIHDLPVVPRGFGDPVQKYFNFQDGERVVAAYAFDPSASDAQAGIALLSDGRGFRFSFQSFCEVSTRNGRRFAKPSEGAEVVGILRTQITAPEPEEGSCESEQLLVVSRDGMALRCLAKEVSFLSGAGRGVTVIKLGDHDRLLGGAVLENGVGALMTARAENGTQIEVTAGQVRLTGRAGKGIGLIKRGQLVLVPPHLGGSSAEPGEESKP